MNYENAFKCNACPQRGDEKGCPMWWEIIETKGQEQRVTKACGYALMPLFILEMVKAAGESSAASNQTRNFLISALTSRVHGSEDKQSEQLNGPSV